MSSLLVLNDNNLGETIRQSASPLLVDFWASWCPPCKMVEPVLEQLAVETRGEAKIAKINIDQNPRAARDFNISGVPTFIVFSVGKEVCRRSGALSKEHLKKMLEQAAGGEKDG